MERTRLRILAVDDDEVDIELLRRCLEESPGFEIELRKACDADELHESLADYAADILFLDYALGAINGLDLLRELRAGGNRIPIVMLTGQGDEQLAVELMKAGATDYLAKARLSPENIERVLHSVSRIGELEKQAAIAEQRLKLAATVFDHVQEGVVVTDAEPRILSVNPAFERITGYREAEVLGENPNVLSSKLHDQAFYEAMWNALLTDGQWKGEIWNRRKTGETYLAWQTISAVTNDAGATTHYVSVFFDITERKQREEYVRYRAYHDALTDLPNRHLFNDRLRQALLYAKREGEMLAVMFMDLDRFKEVNDTLGHDVGDGLLVEVARRLQGCVREGDTLARFGGDEFVLLSPGIRQIDGAVLLAQKILDVLRPIATIHGHEMSIRASIGIAVFPKDGEEPPDLLKKADEAMYLAKRAGGCCYRLAENDDKQGRKTD